MDIKKVLVTIPVGQNYRDKIEEVLPEAEYTYFGGWDPDDERIKPTPEQLEDADVILGSVSPKLLKHCKKLKFFQLYSSGVNLYVNGVLPEGTVMTCATGAYGTAIAECMLAGLFMLQKNMLQYMDNQKKHLWKSAGMTKSICGATVLCVGAGDIGGEFLKRCKALGAHTIGVRRSYGEKPEYMDELYMTDQVDELLGRADVVASVLPETPKTIHFFDEERLSKLRSDAVFINVGRGTTVDNMALAKLLEEGKIGGAVLDVFEKEPLPEDHPIWDAPNTVITPHETGGFTSWHTMNNLAELACENFRRFCSGETLLNQVDFEEGYAKKNK